jgi:hypothetical protein
MPTKFVRCETELKLICTLDELQPSKVPGGGVTTSDVKFSRIILGENIPRIFSDPRIFENFLFPCQKTRN